MFTTEKRLHQLFSSGPLGLLKFDSFDPCLPELLWGKSLQHTPQTTMYCIAYIVNSSVFYVCRFAAWPTNVTVIYCNIISPSITIFQIQTSDTSIHQVLNPCWSTDSVGNSASHCRHHQVPSVPSKHPPGRRRQTQCDVASAEWMHSNLLGPGVPGCSLCPDRRPIPWPWREADVRCKSYAKFKRLQKNH